MRIRSLLTAVAFLATTVFAIEIVAPVPESEEPVDHPVKDPVLAVTASFPESNPFGQVVNGEINKLLLAIENRTGKNVTLLTVAGEFLDPTTEQLIKAANNLTYGTVVPDTMRIQLAYNFLSEFKPGDIKLKVWLEHVTDGEREKISAFDSIVTVVEPELSVFDFKLLSTYAIILAILGGLGYVAYLSFIPQPKHKKSVPIYASASTVAATGAGGHQEEWIPEHHLRKIKTRKVGGTVSSADEQSGLSGAEASGTEGKRRGNRLRK
ncbi:hypothetical protein F5148DRAFT_972590 [Russula earlei]|uniref:Uncharacterized protein n=1 Tax=Russula earlei TaxID=71964 RepID=A0ACC0UNW6_9AGAM|nr:hypothetical protein F5148DRAFT_972590 [Russula earlei]